MIKLVTASDMTKVDEQAQNVYAIPSLVLMEEAGRLAWERAVSLIEHSVSESHIVICAGGGNNGGDALVMARIAASEGVKSITCLLCGTKISDLNQIHRDIITAHGIVKIDLQNQKYEDETLSQILSSADLVIDGIAGTGIKGPLTGPAAKLVTFIREYVKKGIVVSLDVPSGCGDTISASSPTIHADLTIMFGHAKVAGYYPPLSVHCGVIEVVNPTFPLFLLERTPVAARLCTYTDCTIIQMPPDNYKTKRGSVAVFGGSISYPGAPRLTARSAFHARAGLVTLFVNEHIWHSATAEEPSAIVRMQKEPITSGALADFDAIAVGPGWEDTVQNRVQLHEILTSGVPVVLDATAIRIAATMKQDGTWPELHGPLLITPHPGEFAALCDEEQGSSDAFQKALVSVSRQFTATVLYKSQVQWIAHGEELFVVDGMNSTLAVAGSGDVLSGICAAFLAQGYPIEETACNAALVHQKAGDISRDVFGWYDSEDLINSIGIALDELIEGSCS